MEDKKTTEIVEKPVELSDEQAEQASGGFKDNVRTARENGSAITVEKP